MSSHLSHRIALSSLTYAQEIKPQYWGLFAAQNIEKGMVVLHCPVTAATVLSIESIDPQDYDRVIGLEPPTTPHRQCYFPGPDQPLYYVNHHCTDVNLGVHHFGRVFSSSDAQTPELQFVALRDVTQDAELYLDYSTLTSSADGQNGQEWTMECHCNTPQCRKIIRSFHFLPEELKMYYTQQQAVLEYILAETPTFHN